MSVDLFNVAVSRSIRSATTLKSALENFVRFLAGDSDCSVYSIKSSGLNVRICRERYKQRRLEDKIYTDLDFLVDITSIIREFSSRSWLPKYIALQFWPPAVDIPAIYFPGTFFLFDRGGSWIEVPRSFMRFARRSAYIVKRFPARLRARTLTVKHVTEYLFILRSFLREQPLDGDSKIEAAARMMDKSTRTLQRVLARANLTYSNLIEHRRCEVGAELLANPNVRIADIARKLGYKDPSHFSRAFRRSAGVTPSEFRSIQMTIA